LAAPGALTERACHAERFAQRGFDETRLIWKFAEIVREVLGEPKSYARLHVQRYAVHWLRAQKSGVNINKIRYLRAHSTGGRELTTGCAVANGCEL